MWVYNPKTIRRFRRSRNLKLVAISSRWNSDEERFIRYYKFEPRVTDARRRDVLAKLQDDLRIDRKRARQAEKKKAKQVRRLIRENWEH
jgi:hypothetical protein